VRRLNTAIDTFPSNLVANAFGFESRAFFDIDDPVSEPVPVDLGRGE
jgi:LemA protein